jgi:hypothetical protein
MADADEAHRRGGGEDQEPDVARARRLGDRQHEHDRNDPAEPHDPQAAETGILHHRRQDVG